MIRWHFMLLSLSHTLWFATHLLTTAGQSADTLLECLSSNWEMYIETLFLFTPRCAPHTFFNSRDPYSPLFRNTCHHLPVNLSFPSHLSPLPICLYCSGQREWFGSGDSWRQGCLGEVRSGDKQSRKRRLCQRGPDCVILFDAPTSCLLIIDIQWTRIKTLEILFMAGFDFTRLVSYSFLWSFWLYWITLRLLFRWTIQNRL